jgi:hypothetical protein
MSNLFEAAREAIKAAIRQWRFVRYMQAGGNPDTLPF